MANEITVRASLQVNNGNQQYQSRPTSFRANQTNAGGPTPGGFTATTDGVNVSLTSLTTPGLCFLQNLDTVNYVQFGIWDADVSKFYPLGELLPGEGYVLRLARTIGQEYTGTGTTSTDSNQSLRLKGIGGACRVIVQVFEK